MNKKVLALVVLLVVMAVALVACNGKTYKQSAVSGMELDQPVENNGGLVVKQGKHVYYINAYAGADADNTFGTQTKTCLMRAELAADGSVVEGSEVVIVPKNIYSGSTKSGIYIYNNWIYYATPNTDKTKTGTVNTTYLDFYRTSIDRTKTELIYTINARSADFVVTENNILVCTGGNLYKIDLNKQKVTKDNYNVVTERASALTGIYTDNAFNAYSFMLIAAADTDSWKGYNTLAVVDKNGAVKNVITEGTYDSNYTIAVKDYVAEGDSLTVYYTKTDSNSNITLCCYKFDSTDFAFDATKEKQLMYNANTTYAAAVKGLSYAKGALVTTSAAPYIKVVNSKADNTPDTAGVIAPTALARAISIKFVVGDYIYYVNSSSATALFRFKMTAPEGTDTRVEEKVCDMTILSTWIAPETLGDYMYYLDSKTNYTFRVKLDKAQTAEVFGVMTDADKEAYESDED